MTLIMEVQIEALRILVNLKLDCGDGYTAI